MSLTDSEFDRDSRGAKTAEALANAVNGFTDDDYRQFAEAMCHREHRTLQQNFFRAMVAAIKQWAEDCREGRFDLRNEGTVKLSAQIVQSVDDLERLPHV